MSDAVMADSPSPEVLSALRSLDTPTVCNALEVVMPERRGHGFTTVPFVCSQPQLEPMVGFARTATIRAATPPERDADAACPTCLGPFPLFLRELGL